MGLEGDPTPSFFGNLRRFSEIFKMASRVEKLNNRFFTTLLGAYRWVRRI